MQLFFNQNKNVMLKNISFVGFENSRSSTICEPALTTIDQFGFELGKKATELLLKRINNDTYDYTTEKCYDPYDGDETLQYLHQDNPTDVKKYLYNYKNYSFDCPTGYYRSRVANGQMERCKKKFCEAEPYPSKRLENDNMEMELGGFFNDG